MEIAYYSGLVLAVFATTAFIAGLFFTGLAIRNGEFKGEEA